MSLSAEIVRQRIICTTRRLIAESEQDIRDVAYCNKINPDQGTTAKVVLFLQGIGVIEFKDREAVEAPTERDCENWPRFSATDFPRVPNIRQTKLSNRRPRRTKGRFASGPPPPRRWGKSLPVA